MLTSDLGFLLARASGAGVRAVNLALEPVGLRARQFIVLRIVARESPSQRRIADLLGTDPSNVVTLVDELQRADLVRRHPDPHDRRARVVKITVAGRRTLRKAESLASGVQGEITAALSAQEVDALAALLRRLVETTG